MEVPIFYVKVPVKENIYFYPRETFIFSNVKYEKIYPAGLCHDDHHHIALVVIVSKSKSASGMDSPSADRLGTESVEKCYFSPGSNAQVGILQALLLL